MMLNRREFLKSMGIVGAGIAVAPQVAMGEVIKAPVVDAADIEWAPAEIDMSNAEIIIFGNPEKDSWVKERYINGNKFSVCWESEGVFKLE